MRLLQLTLDDAVQNLALDEALLDEAEAAGAPAEVLRIWEPADPLVVVGRSSNMAREVHLAEACRRGIPVLRRSSGGAAIVTGPGCLMYSLVLSYERRPEARWLSAAHALVLDRLAEQLGRRISGHSPAPPLKQPGPVSRQGTSDLVHQDRKFSGNSLRCRRTHLLYHGTLLYRFPTEWIDELLAHPPREPLYRAGRQHRAFVGNIPLERAALIEALCQAWDDPPPMVAWPKALTERLAMERYGQTTHGATPWRAM